jgi:hypothetical protein
MKIKLLKKIRKRYEILEITKVNDISLWHYSSDSKYPYYLLIDNENNYDTVKIATYDATIEYLRLRLRKEYFKYSKKARTIYKKVWYKNGN